MMKKFLQQLASFLNVFWVFLPGVIFIAIGYLTFCHSIEGKDVFLTAMGSRITIVFTILGFFFWVFVSWYTARIISYNHDRLYNSVPKGLYHAPRILGFLCFTVFSSAIAVDDTRLDNEKRDLLILALSILIYSISYPVFEKINRRVDRPNLVKYRNITWFIVIVLLTFSVYQNEKGIYLIAFSISQIAFLFLVITRRKISFTSKENTPKVFVLFTRITIAFRRFVIWLFTPTGIVQNTKDIRRFYETEKRIFVVFCIILFSSSLIYFSSILSLSFARFLTAVPIVMFSFGVLLAAGNVLTIISLKHRINFHFLFIMALVIVGFFNDPHTVVLTDKSVEEKQLIRPDARSYFVNWLNERKEAISDSTQETFPVYIVLADGGASRASFWTGSVLAKIETETHAKFSGHLFCLSGSSGGSIGNFIFWKTITDSSKYSMDEIQQYLSDDFLSFPLAHLLGPDLILPFFPKALLLDRADALETALINPRVESKFTNFLQQNFSSTFPNTPKNFMPPLLCINCTRMQDGAPAVIANFKIDTLHFGNRIDILSEINSNNDLSIASSLVLGSRFPYFCPAGRVGETYYVDGGYFDNSGVGVAHELIVNLQEMIQDSLKINPNHSLKKIRFHVIRVYNKGASFPSTDRVHPLVNDLSAPVKTILGSYRSHTGYSNLNLRNYLHQLYGSEDTYHDINLFRRNEKSHYPLNWAISKPSIDSMQIRLENHHVIQDLIRSINNTR
jgi:hypothetical protein